MHDAISMSPRDPRQGGTQLKKGICGNCELFYELKIICLLLNTYIIHIKPTICNNKRLTHNFFTHLPNCCVGTEK